MGIQFSDGVENIVGKDEIGRYKQFLLCPRFQKLSVVDTSKRVSMELTSYIMTTNAHSYAASGIHIYMNDFFFFTARHTAEDF